MRGTLSLPLGYANPNSKRLLPSEMTTEIDVRRYIYACVSSDERPQIIHLLVKLWPCKGDANVATKDATLAKGISQMPRGAILARLLLAGLAAS